MQTTSSSESTPAEAPRYLYVDAALARAALVTNPAVAATTERHHLRLDVAPADATTDPAGDIRRSGAAGAIFEQRSGLPSQRLLDLLAQIIGTGARAWLYWPAEEALECIDEERLRSLRRLLHRVTWMKRIVGPIDRALTRWDRVPTALRWIYRGEFPVRRSDIFVKLNLLSVRAQPVALDVLAQAGEPPRLPGTGVFLRTDFWARTENGDHDRRVAGELASAGERVVCLTPRHDARLDEAGIHQVVLDDPRQTEGQDAIVLAPTHYWPIVKAALQSLRPSYLYERLSAAQSVAAELSQLLHLPYIVEHPGSEVMLREAIGGADAVYPEVYAKAEELALRQATVVLVSTRSGKDALVEKGIDASRIMVEPGDAGMGGRLAAFVAAQAAAARPAESLQTGDSYKDQVQKQWNNNPVGSQHARESQPHTLEWFLEVEKHRYGAYAPWMPATMEMAAHAGHDVLEIGGGMGTDLAQFAAHGASVTDLDLSVGHLQLAEENFRLRGLSGRFIHHDAERLPFDDGSFDVVYSNGVLHHTPNTADVVREIHRVLRPGGRAIVMFYAENSYHYWRNLVWALGIKEALLDRMSMGEIMSRSVERTANEAKPLVKVYTKARLRALFKEFAAVEIVQRQLLAEELPAALTWAAPAAEPRLGWNLIVKATRH